MCRLMVQQAAPSGARYQGIAGPATEQPGHSDGIGSESLKRLYGIVLNRVGYQVMTNVQRQSMLWLGPVKLHLVM